MSMITQPGKADTREVAKRIKTWFIQQGFETKAFEQDGAFTLKACKCGGIRTLLGADRAIEVDIRIIDNQTQVEVRQGSWKTNAVSSVGFLLLTGGLDILLVAGWSAVIQKQLETHIKEILEDVCGVNEVEL